mgnify:CR=1 FL=1
MSCSCSTSLRAWIATAGNEADAGYCALVEAIVTLVRCRTNPGGRIMLEQRVGENLPDWIRDHLQRYLASDGADGHYWDASPGGGEGMVPTLLLTTRGRKSGRSMTIPLIYGQAGDGYCVVASKGGAPAHPAWFLNLEADPQVHVQVEADRFLARARRATDAERGPLWQQMVGIFGPYTDYQARTERTIPLVILEPER